jgi:hypothetical protein
MSPVISGFPPLGRWTRWGWNSSSYPQARTIQSSPYKHVDTFRRWPRSRRSRVKSSWPFMSNYIEEWTELIEQLTIHHKAYFDICRQELHTEISVLQDLICDINYIIADVMVPRDRGSEWAWWYLFSTSTKLCHKEKGGCTRWEGTGLWIEDKVETEALNCTLYMLNTATPQGLCLLHHIVQGLAWCIPTLSLAAWHIHTPQHNMYCTWQHNMYSTHKTRTYHK